MVALSTRRILVCDISSEMRVDFATLGTDSLEPLKLCGHVQDALCRAMCSLNDPPVMMLRFHDFAMIACKSALLYCPLLLPSDHLPPQDLYLCRVALMSQQALPFSSGSLGCSEMNQPLPVCRRRIRGLSSNGGGSADQNDHSWSLLVASLAEMSTEAAQAGDSGLIRFTSEAL